VTLTASELDAVEQGLPRLEQWGVSASLPFVANRLRHARVIWTNERWLLERGVNIIDTEVRARVENWLIESFAYVVPTDNVPGTAIWEDSKIFLADRYGSSDSSEHGGSGRAGISGCFQVKGIGPTPLIGGVDEWLHSHGCVWLEEAIREAICGEVASAELPYGALRALAILDCGFNYVGVNGKRYERRALIVRPSCCRPAHLQRAVMFKPKDGDELAHLDDVDRVRQAVSRLSTQKDSDSTSLVGLPELFHRLSKQIAYGLVNRLEFGSYLCSNMTMQGELLDFGAFGATKDWEAAFVPGYVPRQFRVNSRLKAAVKSIIYYFNKYNERGVQLDEFEYSSKCDHTIASAFRTYCEDIWQADFISPDLRLKLAALTERYMRSRKAHLSAKFDGFDDNQSLFFPTDGQYSIASTDSVLQEAAELIETASRDLDDGHVRLRMSIGRANRLLRGRSALDRSALQKRIYAQIGGPHKTSVQPAGINDLILKVVSESRRHWPHLKNGLVVLGQEVDGHATFLYCLDAYAEERVLWVEAPKVGGCVAIRGWLYPEEEIVLYEDGSDEIYWRGVFPAAVYDNVLSAAVSSITQATQRYFAY
jgi:hypothetical protein